MIFRVPKNHGNNNIVMKDNINKNPIASFVNCTPHDITVAQIYEDEFTVYPRSGVVPRLNYRRIEGRTFNDVTIRTNDGAEVMDMPRISDYPHETIFIVSKAVAEYLAARGHGFRFVSPGEAIRDDAGSVIACDGFTHHGQGKSDIVRLHDQFCNMDINQESQ